MEIITNPHTLKVDSNSNACNCCNNILDKEIKRGRYLIDECGNCRYLDRPFAGCGRATHHSNYDDGCSCEYGEKDYLYITCKKCLSPNCVKCGAKCDCMGKGCNEIICINCLSPNCVKCGAKFRCMGEGCNEIICINCLEKEKFNNDWKKMTPTEKLHVYGVKKLKILAKNKKIKGFSQFRLWSGVFATQKILITLHSKKNYIIYF
jgi:hypothetical protein